MRERNATQTRVAILNAAREAFTLSSFDQVGVRQITDAAGVNSSLVNRYFGTKERLFAEVLQSNPYLDRLCGSSLCEMINFLTDSTLKTSVEGPAFDPFLALIRSAPVKQAQPVLRDYLTREVIAPLARLIGGHGADERASFVAAFLIGVIIMRDVLQSEPLSSAKTGDMAVRIRAAVCSFAAELVDR